MFDANILLLDILPERISLIKSQLILIVSKIILLQLSIHYDVFSDINQNNCTLAVPHTWIHTVKTN